MRFGNVLGSRGSVLTSFAAQIAAGGPVTVTDPEVTRYFMTIEEAVQLVIQAGAIGRDGEALVLDMGEPVRIDDVARQLIELVGQARSRSSTPACAPGEKLHEELFGEGEADERPDPPADLAHVPVPRCSARGGACRCWLDAGVLRDLEAIASGWPRACHWWCVDAAARTY